MSEPGASYSQGFGNDGYSRIPGWDGSPQTWRRYKRAVEIWIEGENLEVSYSIAARMVTKLTGTARNRADLIPLTELRPIRAMAAVEAREANPSTGEPPTPYQPAVEADWMRGINRLMEELEKMPGIPLVVKKGSTRKWFYDNLSRRPAESMSAWLTRFRLALQRCADDGVPMTDQEDLGWWLLKKSLLTEEREERLLTAVNSDYTFAVLEAKMLVLFGSIHISESSRERTPFKGTPAGKRPWTRKPSAANAAEAVGEGEAEEAVEGQQPGDVDDARSEQADTVDGSDAGFEEAVEQEMDVLATVLEQNQEFIEDEGEKIEAAAEQLHEALVTLRQARQSIQAKAKDRGYKGSGAGAKARAASPHPKRGGGASSSSAAHSHKGSGKKPGAMDAKKQKSQCWDCDEYGHWRGDACCTKPGAALGALRRGKEAHVRVCEFCDCDAVWCPLCSDDADGPLDVGTDLAVHSVNIADASTFYCGAEDSACNKSVCGGKWMDNYIERLQELGLSYTTEDKLGHFRFGGGERLTSFKVYTIPVSLKGRCGLIRVAVIRQGKGNDLEFLMGKDIIKEAGFINNWKENTMQIYPDTTWHKFDDTSAGHTKIPLLELPADGWKLPIMKPTSLGRR